MFYKIKSQKYFTIFCLVILVNCKNSASDSNEKVYRSLSSDNGTLDLAQSSIEQQKIDKEKAALEILAARENRIIVTVEDLLDENLTSKFNIALYARSTKNKLGEKIYLRPRKKKKQFDPCLRFAVSDDAQRYFLQLGGPEKDILGLDQDGDGFACDWDPRPYKKLEVK